MYYDLNKYYINWKLLFNDKLILYKYYKYTYNYFFKVKVSDLLKLTNKEFIYY